MSSHKNDYQAKKRVREDFEQCTGLKLKSVKMPGRRFQDLFSLGDNTLIILKYCKFLSEEEYPYFFGISGALLDWMLTEWEKAKIWFILDDAKHVAFMEGINIGRKLLESETSSFDSRGQGKIKVTEGYEMWLDSEIPLIDIKEYMLPEDEKERLGFWKTMLKR